MIGSASRSPCAFVLPTLLAVTLVGLVGSGCSDEDPMAEARALQAAGRLEESLEPLRSLLVSDPDSAEVHYRYGVALARTGRGGMAVWSLRRARQDPNWASLATLELARAAMLSMNWANAIEAATELLSAEPDNLDALRIRAEAYMGQMTQPELALADLERAIELAPDEVGLRTGFARALIMTDRIDEAVEAVDELQILYKEASARDRRMLGPVCALGVIFAKERGELEQAMEALDRCLEAHPSEATVLDLATGLLDESGEFERATGLLRTALESAPTSLRYRTILAARLRGINRDDEAEAVLRAGFELKNPGMTESLWTALAQHHVELNDLEAAADAYGNAVAISPQVSEIGWLTYADMLAAAGRSEAALEVASRMGTKHYRQLVEAHVRLDQGDARRALEILDEVLPLWPNNAGARYFAARAAEQLGDVDRAIEEYRQSIRSDASATDAGFRLAKTSLALDDKMGAWVAAHHHFKAQPGDRAGHLLMVRMAIRRGGPVLREQLKKSSQTPLWPAAISLQVDAIAEREGVEEAVRRLRALSLDLTKPWNADALRTLVRHLVASGDEAAAKSVVAAALEAHPQEARFHAIAGFERELSTGSVAGGREQYARALELDPDEPQALEALARIAVAAGDIPTGIEHFDRAALADPGNAAIPIRAARILQQSGGSAEEVDARWKRVFREFPWEPAPLLALSRLAQARQDSKTALDFAQRAVRLGGGHRAWQQLATVYEMRGEQELARQARERATRETAAEAETPAEASSEKS